MLSAWHIVGAQEVWEPSFPYCSGGIGWLYSFRDQDVGPNLRPCYHCLSPLVCIDPSLQDRRRQTPAGTGLIFLSNCSSVMHSGVERAVACPTSPSSLIFSENSEKGTLARSLSVQQAKPLMT